jgi:hypothetical protein
MKKRIFLAFLLSVLLVVPAAACDDVFNFLKQGYGFIIDDTSIGAVGLLEPLQTQNPPFDFDFDNFEVSWALQDMVIDDFTQLGPLQIWDLLGGTIGIYEDASFDLDYGADPATGLATATNGDPALTGVVHSATYIYNMISATGSFSGTFAFTAGSRFAELGQLTVFDWDVFNGTSAEAAVSVPTGYHTRFAGRIFVCLIGPVEETTMGQIKALYE